MSETTPKKHATLAAALAQAQRNARAACLPAKGVYGATNKRTNERTSYKYPKVEHAYDWASLHLTDNGLAFMPGPTTGAPVVEGNRVIVPFGYALLHADTSERREWVVWWPVCEPDRFDLSKGIKNASSACGKYALMDLLCQRSEADDEEPFHGIGETDQEKAEAALPPPPPLPAPVVSGPSLPASGHVLPLPAPRQEAQPKAAPLPAPAAQAVMTDSAIKAVPIEAQVTISQRFGDRRPSELTPTEAKNASGAAAPPPAPPAPTAGPPTAPTETQAQRNARMVAAVDATGMPGAAFSQYVCETVIPGCADLTALDAASAEKVIAAAAALKARPLAPGEVARLEAAWNAPEAQPPLPPPAPAGGADFPFGKNAPALPPPTTPAKCVLDDPALAARWAVFKRDASQARVAKGLTSEALIPIANQWARRPGLLAAGKALEGRAGTEGEVTAEVLSLLEAGLAEWKKEPATAGVGR